jgi:hypothetical protein
MVLRRIFGSRREEVAGGWGRYNAERQNIYSSPNIVRAIISNNVEISHRMGKHAYNNKGIEEFRLLGCGAMYII